MRTQTRGRLQDVNAVAALAVDATAIPEKIAMTGTIGSWKRGSPVVMSGRSTVEAATARSHTVALRNRRRPATNPVTARTPTHLHHSCVICRRPAWDHGPSYRCQFGYQSSQYPSM